MIDHVEFEVLDLGRSRRFYIAALKPLDLIVHADKRDAAGRAVFISFGPPNARPGFALLQGHTASPPMHVAFAAPTRRAVELFHQAALAAGGRDNGAPGLRPHYHANYYAAFILDPDGHNIEAVCHACDGGE